MNVYEQIGTGNNHNASAALSDAALVCAAKAGDHSAFSELLSRHAKKILNSIHRITKNRHDAEDVLQDTFTRAYVHLKSFNEQSAFSTWLHRIAINSAIMFLRKRRPHLELSIDSNPESASSRPIQIIDDRANAAVIYEEWEQEQRLKRAIGQLQPDLRSIFELRHQQDQSLAQISMTMGISVTALKSRFRRAKTVIRKSMERAIRSTTHRPKP
jgi:RNA polymerase sigma-70 factor (ECF subfamily)